MELKRIALGRDATARAHDRLSAIKELLKLEPAAPEKDALGSVWHVYPDRVVPDALRAEHGEEVSQP